jgi:hypothetical protein
LVAAHRLVQIAGADAMFQLTVDEAEALRFQIGILQKGLHFKYLPYVFTQKGVALRKRR